MNATDHSAQVPLGHLPEALPTCSAEMPGEMASELSNYVDETWMIRWGRVLLLLQMGAPILRYFADGLSHRVAGHPELFLPVAVLFMLWNLFFLKGCVLALGWNSVDQIECRLPAPRIALILSGQFIFSFICHDFSRHLPPEGFKVWFWMPVAIFASFILSDKLSLVLLFVVISPIVAAYEWFFNGPRIAVIWTISHTAVSGFIWLCIGAVKFAATKGREVAIIAAELRKVNRQLAEQSDQVVRLAVAEERNHIAREIHDAVGHGLAVVGAQLEVAHILMNKDNERATQALEKAQESTQSALRDIRRSVSALRVESLHEQPLPDALAWLVQSLDRPRLSVTFSQKGPSRYLASQVCGALFRCAQEGLTNAARHAQASEVTVELDFQSDNSVTLTVADNGKGTSSTPGSGVGLQGLHERAALLKGSFSAQNSPHGGFVCQISIPTS